MSQPRKNSLLSLLNGNNWGSFNRPLAVLLGLAEAVLLSELINKHQFFGEQDDGWFYMTTEALNERTGLKRYAQEGAIKTLKKMDLIETTTKGLPARRHFRLNIEKVLGLIEQLETGGPANKIAGTCKLASRNLQTEEALDSPYEASHAYTYKEKHKEKHSLEGGTSPPDSPPPPPSRKREKVAPPEKKERERDIWLTDWEVQKLESKTGKDRLPSIFEETSAWKQEKGITGGNDYRLLLRWIKNLGSQPAPSKASSFPTSNSRELLRNIKEKYPDEQKWGVRYEEGAIIFTGGAVDNICRCDEKDFLDRIAVPMKNRSMFLS